MSDLSGGALRAGFILCIALGFAAGCSGGTSSPLPRDAASTASHARPNSDAAAVAAAVNAAIASIPSPTPPGMAFAVYYRGKPYFFYRGVLRVGGAKVGDNTIFELGSLTKSFTGIMLGAAVDRRVKGVTLADPPAHWIAIAGAPNATAPHPESTVCPPATTATPIPPSEYGTVTRMSLLELATHTSGLPDLPPGTPGTWIGRQCFSRQQFVNWVEGGSFTPPPAPWLYSDAGFGTLGYVLQGIHRDRAHAPRSWYELVRRQLLIPLGMRHTFNLKIPAAYRSAYAQGYQFHGTTPVQQLHWEWSPWPAAGALRSTAPDMMRYMLLALGISGPPEMLEAAQTAERPYVSITPGEQQGLGWETVRLYPPSSPSPPPPTVSWKDGGTAGFSTWIGVVRGKQPMGVVVLFNEAGAGYDGPLGRAIMTALYLRNR